VSYPPTAILASGEPRGFHWISGLAPAEVTRRNANPGNGALNRE